MDQMRHTHTHAYTIFFLFLLNTCIHKLVTLFVDMSAVASCAHDVVSHGSTILS